MQPRSGIDEDGSAAGDERPPLPPGLLARLRADPLRAPETIALAAAEQHAPAAEAWVAERRGDKPPAKLAKTAKTRHARMARAGGAATGLGGALTILPDLLALAWIQSRLVFFVAAAYGHDPYDRMRPAELLVLQELYHEPSEARIALDGAGRSIAQAYVDRRLAPRDEALTRRLLAFVGKRAVNRLAGRAIPGVAVAVNAIGNERDTRALADRAIRFYERPA